MKVPWVFRTFDMPSFKIIIGTLFGLLIVAVVVLGVVSYRYNEEVVNSSFSINHTYRVMLAADEISATSRDLQLESNAIFIQRDTTRTESYRAARKEIYLELDDLRNLSRENAGQKQSIDSLSKLISDLVLFGDVGGSVLRQPNVEADILDRIAKTKALREQITVVLNRIKSKELNQLRLREANNSRSIASFNKAFGELLAVIALLAIVAFFSIRYNFNKLIKIDEQLRTAQEKTEKALATEIELNKLKSNFVALASHEFRTPLTTVLSSAALLESYSFGENQGKVNRHISRIKSSVNSLTSILDEFLSLSRIEEGKMQPNFEKLDIKHYLQDCVSNLQNFAKPGQVISYAHAGRDEIETDPVFIANIINNLVTNAIKYSPENSPIEIYSHVNGGIHLTVKDHGIGIPKEDQKHLFERFYRASNAGTVHGTGLGLHIMKHYVDMLNGEVKIESEVGKGTLIHITLQSSGQPGKND